MNDVLQLRPLQELLNREADAGAVAIAVFREKPVSEWLAVLAAHPEWRSYGPFRAILRLARENFYDESKLALEITTFVVANLYGVAVPADAPILLPVLQGFAWKEHANALFISEKPIEAAQAAATAIAIFSTHPAMQLHEATAKLVRAHALHITGNTTEALDLIFECIRVFNASAESRKLMNALEICGGILIDLEAYDKAADAYLVALDTAEYLHDDRAIARTTSGLGQGALYLGNLEEAERYLQRAFVMFGKQKMSTEILRTVAAIARVAIARGELEDARDLLHTVYAGMLQKGMHISAAWAHVALGEVVTELTGNLVYAGGEWATFADTLVDYDVKGEVRDVMQELRRETAVASDVVMARNAFGKAKQTLESLLRPPTNSSPSATSASLPA